MSSDHVSDILEKAHAAKDRLIELAERERVIARETRTAAYAISDRSSALAHNLRKTREKDGADEGRDTAYGSIVLSGALANTALGSLDTIDSKLDKI